ncbi:MAG: CDP-glucose 4,6-dehydratase, partial [Ghiorsea sp.]|nr:CDP-glucose 4,6-dehydratase [Ghiorsea sp.]
KWGNGASWQLDQGEHPHEAGYLKLDISKAKSKLGWRPTWHLEETLVRIVCWHQAWLGKQDMQSVCLNEIDQFMQDMK